MKKDLTLPVEIDEPLDTTTTVTRAVMVKGRVLLPPKAEVQVLVLSHDGRWYAQDFPQLELRWRSEVQVGAEIFKGGKAVLVTDPVEIEQIRANVAAGKDDTKRWYQIAAAVGPRLAKDVVSTLPADRPWSIILVQRGDPE